MDASCGRGSDVLARKSQQHRVAGGNQGLVKLCQLQTLTNVLVTNQPTVHTYQHPLLLPPATTYRPLLTSQPTPYGWSICQLLKNWWLQRPCMGGYMRVRFVFRRGRVGSPARQQARQRGQRAAVTRWPVASYNSPAKCSQLQPPQPAGAACSQRPPAPREYLIGCCSRAPVPATHSLHITYTQPPCPLPVSGFEQPPRCPLPSGAVRTVTCSNIYLFLASKSHA